MNQLTPENLKARNRTEKLFTAFRCCEPVKIRTTRGKVPYFYHVRKSAGCAVARRETPEHLSITELAVALVA